MRIELPTRAAADAVAEYLRLCNCIVSRADECALDASASPRSQSMKASEIEVEGYLRVWEALHPTIGVVRVFNLPELD